MAELRSRRPIPSLGGSDARATIQEIHPRYGTDDDRAMSQSVRDSFDPGHRSYLHGPRSRPGNTYVLPSVENFHSVEGMSRAARERLDRHSISGRREEWNQGFRSRWR
jgi:hypothetical protein